MKVLYALLPVLVLAAVYRMLTAERADFSLVLVVITALSGIVWALDAWLLRPRRDAAARAAGRDPAALADPGTVDYARSFFPVAFVLLVLRSFLFEPYRIPSDSMMPTLLDGDFIVVNKFAYGLRLPVTHEKFYGSGQPPAATSWCSASRPTRRSTTSSGSWACPATWCRCAPTAWSSTASRCRSARSPATATAATSTCASPRSSSASTGTRCCTA